MVTFYSPRCLTTIMVSILGCALGITKLANRSSKLRQHQAVDERFPTPVRGGILSSNSNSNSNSNSCSSTTRSGGVSLWVSLAET
jgi:hypothetical protein